MVFGSGLPLSEMWILVGAAYLAGLVRGFAGFGTALIFLPFAGMVLSPVQAITVLVLMDIVGPLPMLPRAARHVDKGDLARLLGGAVVALPLGLYALFLLDSQDFRYLVSGASLIMLTGLVLGWRYAGALPPRAVAATGAASGFLGGVVGVPGPPVIFVYMASPKPATSIRANITFYLFGYDWMVLAMMGLAGRLDPGFLVTGLMLIVPNMLGTVSGAALFVPGYERAYRLAAYGLILGAALSGLPFWSAGE
ncbi:sulfite exporter TauE/SafE family protein [Ruegeria sp. WL0004]|uniref:Probable membrane transporter protein n=1 Tax=Ruegeria marisflavi TaxID=2984152 RepID=A0ABT2WQA4_9RHOB|nr:sulfite exporter TauE/SafE family protein [Ruegeria sp. WL0004]MCU9838036.1 sulfite exporter TauE/SafE family protein [Ruegeria sp. WL0004]